VDNLAIFEGKAGEESATAETAACKSLEEDN